MGSASVQVTVPAERSNGSAALTYIFGKRKTLLADDLFPTLRGITVPCWGVLFGCGQMRAGRFCEWPGPRKLRYRDVVNYVVVDEYMRSHLTDFRGTYTNMRRVVTSIIPYHL
jgi:hypothetical protein